MLEVRDLHAAYGDAQVLFGASLSVKEGEIVALLGSNGAG
jgi:branched-chain amino acid transport system ATP-binding protein